MERESAARQRRVAERTGCRGATDVAAASVSDRWIQRTRRRLLRWGRSHFRSYPWRFEESPWLTFVAEFMLQRTRATQVEPVFRAFRDRYPAADRLARAGAGATRHITNKLGLHWRGPLLLRLARAIAQRGGTPPETMEELRALPGVGMYTAAAWLSLHRGKRAVIIDANVARWLSRMTGLPYNRDPRHVSWVQSLAARLTPPRAFRAFNYAVLDFTMTICASRVPRCDICPLRRDCRYGQIALGNSTTGELTTTSHGSVSAWRMGSQPQVD